MWPYNRDLVHAEIKGTIHNWRYQDIELLNEQLTKVCDWRQHNLVIEIASSQKLIFNLNIVFPGQISLGSFNLYLFPNLCLFVSFVSIVHQYMVT